ncbi:hypothetical protein BN2476_190021 [Paraburkholderia piptadeniae]|uniref:Uncharacterized protein n=1 Tax=Paraburkholderia piptadeniae TaxID=1701573 RepID=A0A1N7RUK9_9BURK|nr:hypothetical protein BN2476_190021 [Paraburkholderia piptadeniae]
MLALVEETTIRNIYGLTAKAFAEPEDATNDRIACSYV